MIFWILLVIFIVLLLWWYIHPPEEIEFEQPPTIHAKCQSNQGCGDSLVCDLNCHRCRKKIGGDCSNDVDCESGLKCHNWKCTDNTHHSPIIDTKTKDKTTHKSVHWNEDKNETRYI